MSSFFASIGAKVDSWTDFALHHDDMHAEEKRDRTSIVESCKHGRGLALIIGAIAIAVFVTIGGFFGILMAIVAGVMTHDAYRILHNLQQMAESKKSDLFKEWGKTTFDQALFHKTIVAKRIFTN